MIAARLETFLKESRVHYEVISHRLDYQAQQAAVDTDTPQRDFAKTLFVCIDGCYAMAVMPANHFLSERKLREILGVDEVRLATEDEFEGLCPDSVMGAEPPFGNLYGLEVYVSPALAEDEEITFNAGSHEEVVRMAYRDFERLVRARVVPMSRHDFVHA
jgi:Ala-tRNA(Pro) deacylase